MTALGAHPQGDEAGQAHGEPGNARQQRSFEFASTSAASPSTTVGTIAALATW